MRWLFALLVMLNAAYYVWQRYEAPLRIKDVTPLTLYKGGQQEIRLVREAGEPTQRKRADECLLVGGVADQEQLQLLRQRLLSLDISTKPLLQNGPAKPGFWLRVDGQSERLLDQPVLSSLSKDFKDLKREIILCEGVASPD